MQVCRSDLWTQRGQGAGVNGERSVSTHTVGRQTASCREGSVVHGPSPVLWDDGEGWEWEEGGSGEKGYIYIYKITAVSHRCMAEKQHKILKQFSSN